MNFKAAVHAVTPIIRKHWMEIAVFSVMLGVPTIIFGTLAWQKYKPTSTTALASPIPTKSPSPSPSPAPSPFEVEIPSPSPSASASTKITPKPTVTPSPKMTPTPSSSPSAPSPTPTQNPTPSPIPTPSPSPSPSSSSIDLEMVDLVYHDDVSNEPNTPRPAVSPPFPAGKQIQIRYKIRNNGPNTSGSYNVTFVINGETSSSQTNAPTIAPGGWNGPSEDVTSSRGMTVKSGENKIEIKVESLGPTDTNSSNNQKTFTFQST